VVETYRADFDNLPRPRGGVSAGLCSPSV